MRTIILHKGKGTNQYGSKYPNLRALVFIVLFTFSLFSVFVIRKSEDNFIRANVRSYDVYASENAPRKIAAIPTAIPTPSQLETIVSYITKKFEPEGKETVVWAIKCFYSESGLRTEAVNKKNSNGTVDRGIAQVNSVHNYSAVELHTIEGNIDRAYEIYKRQGRTAWYAPECN